jgi:hypothetical protein
VQDVTQLLKTQNFVGGVERTVILSQKLLMPLRRQQAKDLARVIRRALHGLSSHALRLL